MTSIRDNYYMGNGVALQNRYFRGDGVSIRERYLNGAGDDEMDYEGGRVKKAKKEKKEKKEKAKKAKKAKKTITLSDIDELKKQYENSLTSDKEFKKQMKNELKPYELRNLRREEHKLMGLKKASIRCNPFLRVVGRKYTKSELGKYAASCRRKPVKKTQVAKVNPNCDASLRFDNMTKQQASVYARSCVRKHKINITNENQLNISQYLLPQARQLAKELNIKGRSKMNKAELIDALVAHYG